MFLTTAFKDMFKHNEKNSFTRMDILIFYKKSLKKGRIKAEGGSVLLFY